MSKKYYVGWLYASIGEYDELKEMGVFGPMFYAPDNSSITKALGKDGKIGYCYCDYETLLKLQDKYKEVWRTRYPHWTPGDIYPDFDETSKKQIKKLGGVHARYHWNDEQSE